jgi:hypothetical protein
VNPRAVGHLLARELGCIAAIERAELAEKNPEWIVFLRESKADHQNAAGKLESLSRALRKTPRGGAPAAAGGL